VPDDVLDVEAPEERGAEYPLPPVAPDRLGPLAADRPAVLIAPLPPPDEPLEALLDPPLLDPPLEPPLDPPFEPPPPEDPPPPAAAAAAAAIAPCADAGAGEATSHTKANADAVVNDQAGRFRFMAGTSTSAMSNPAAIAPLRDRLSIGPFWPSRTQKFHEHVSIRRQESRFLDTLDQRPIESKHTVFHSTTILAVRHRDKAVLAGDGQVTFGQTVVKQTAKKIRRLYNDRILAGFAGSAADSFALFSRFESKLEQYRGNLERSAVELAKDWRSDRILRRLEAMLIVLDKDTTFLLSGNGDLIEPDDGLVAIGSGGPYALAAAKALALNTDLDARTIAEKAMAIAGEICIYTNTHVVVEEL